MKKYWEVVPLHAVRTTMPNTLLSLTGSIPWLISSTTRKGQRLSSCRAMR
uniref:Uncharacterized protein n=1 Tax=Anguilla anguilla TaxID=7936 RepID=A0A0E9RTD9_ANGAN